MTTQEKIIRKFKEIGFVNRYSKIYLRSLEGEDQLFENYDNDKVLSILQNLGYSFKYFKKENFFGLNEYINDIEVIFNISCKYGLVELITTIKKDGLVIRPCGPWNSIVKQLGRSEIGVKKPRFRNYEELLEILKQAFILHEDLKGEISKIEF